MDFITSHLFWMHLWSVAQFQSSASSSKRMTGIGQLTKSAFRIKDLLWNPYFSLLSCDSWNFVITVILTLVSQWYGRILNGLGLRQYILHIDAIKSFVNMAKMHFFSLFKLLISIMEIIVLPFKRGSFHLVVGKVNR